jgi:DNA primase
VTGYEDGRNIWCPFHQGHKPSMHIFLDTGLAYCFSETRLWDAVGFMAQYQHKSYSLVLDELCEEYGITINLDDIPKIKPPTTDDTLLSVTGDGIQDVDTLFENDLTLVGPPKKRLLKILKNWDTWTTIINSY